MPKYINGYRATIDGDIIGKRGRVLKLAIYKSGYKFFSQNLGTRIPNPTLVHRFVWEYFNGPILKDLQVDHINNVKTDNRLLNLQLLTPKENTRKSIKCKLSAEDKISILEMLNTHTGRYIADIFGVSTAMISMIKKGKR